MKRETPKSYTRLYRIWQNMKKRCYNKKEPAYRWYGAKGITVCKEWRESSDAFIEWALSHGYRDDLTIDRIRVARGYCPSNCRWITRSENSKRSRKPGTHTKDCHIRKMQKMFDELVAEGEKMDPSKRAKFDWE